MPFKPNAISLPVMPHLLEPIENEDLLFNCQLTQFDREGYELLPIEQEYYKANNILMHKESVFGHESGSYDGWSAVIQKWFKQIDETVPYKLDHSFCVVRYNFEGRAKIQIQKAAQKRPELSKLLRVIPKWGHDFCVDFVTPEKTYELIHWEWDFRSYSDFNTHRAKMEQIVSKVDWEKINDTVKHFNATNTGLTAETEGNFRAALFGLNKAFNLYKSF